MSSETFNWAWATMGGAVGLGELGWGGRVASILLPLPRLCWSAPRGCSLEIQRPRQPEPQEVPFTGSSRMKALLETCRENNTARASRGEEEEWWSTLG